MKKNHNLTNSHHKDGQEQSKKIYRSISDHVKRLDDARGCSNKVIDLFTPTIQIQRSKLREYCDRLIFLDPILYGLKAEELLWRKGYYDVISTAKRIKKLEYTIEEKSCLITHINAGIGHYHNYISRLQSEYQFELINIDFGLFKTEFDRGFADFNLDEFEWAKMSLHRSLIYLGDLCRYKLDVYPNWDPNLAIRYYLQALIFKPEFGMPHNQMGTLASNLNQFLDATYHYIQCLMCQHSFDGTENNLLRLFEKNSQFLEQIPIENPDADAIIQIEQSEHIKRFTARFLLLTDVWFFNKKIPHIYDLCHQTNVDLQECLSYLKPVASESSGSQNGDSAITDTDSIISPAFISQEMCFKIIVICLLCITKLQNNKNSQQLSNVIAFTLAVYSQLVQHVLSHIQESVLNFPLPEKVSKQKRVLRRRKKLTRGSDDESDVSDIELSDESDLSEDECVSSSTSDDELDESAKLTHELLDDKKESDNNAMLEILKKSKLIETKDMIDIISDEIYLQGIKILSDWLISDTEVLKSCGKTTRSLFSQVINLINLINIDLSHVQIDAIAKDCDKMPLSEDVTLKGLDVLSGCQKDLVWDYFGRTGCVSPKDEVVLRVAKLVSFGHVLARFDESGVSYDLKSKEFTVKPNLEEESNESPAIFDEMEMLDAESNNAKTANNKCETKGQLMKHMGQLWLAAEVKDLETRVKGKMSLSPYLVVDVDALIKYMNMVKQLVKSKKFIVLVPSAVLSALDDLKKDKLEAREAIRWLEAQFHSGNRFFRAQRPQERLPIPYIKYPKKKDKESYIYIQIIECCHYLAEQQKKGLTNLVTLLMGGETSSGENREFSFVGLAQTAGVNLELITEFYVKWKKASKGKR